MNTPISVMIIDDSLVFRTLLREVLSDNDKIRIVTQAVNGRLALPRIKHYVPDIVILDQDMPEMSGLELLELVHKDYPDMKFIMFSSYNFENVKTTIKALELGVIDFIQKPTFSDELQIKKYINDELVTKILSLNNSNSVFNYQLKTSDRTDHKIPGSYHICAIGISTGGPYALKKLLMQIPSDLDGSIVIVQHMPPVFTKQLAESLNEVCQVEVIEGEDKMFMQNGTVYIAPGGKHMILERLNNNNMIRIIDTPPEKNCKPSVNVLFRSIAELYNDDAVVVIMTGMGDDGYESMIKLKKVGAYLLAQNQASCLVFGMPSKPINDGIVDEVLDIESIAVRITELLGTY